MENYEQKYKESLERCKSWMKGEHPECFSEAQKAAEFIFPELRESEDERIRKALIRFFSKSAEYDSSTNGIKDRNIIAWLEKQGEQKSYGQRKECLDCQFNYAGECKGFCAIKRGEQKPATIEIDKMVDDYANNKERGNEEFGKPVNCMIRAYRQGLIDAIGKVVLKPAWSEEDEKLYNWCLACIQTRYNDGFFTKSEYNRTKLWLKSLKDRIQPQPKQEWCDEDEKHLSWLIEHLGQSAGLYDNLIDWLKSLKPQNHWKPSEEQMEALFEAKLASIKNREYFLGLLYEDLKKL